MCVIIVNKSGTLSDYILQNAATTNPDGAGLMYYADEQLHSYRSMDSGKVIKKYLDARQRHPDSVMFLHFRIGTSGTKNRTNCHPFPVNRGALLMHNGVLYDYSDPTSNLNDTRLFIQKVLSHVPENELFSDWLLPLVEKAISGNKFVMLNDRGEWVILNEIMGRWEGENWFSNMNWVPRMTRTVPPDNTRYTFKGRRQYECFNF